MNRADFTPFAIDSFTIFRRPLRGTPNTIYSVMLDGREIGRQISYPDLRDCEWYRMQFEAREREGRDEKAPRVKFRDTKALTDRIINILKLEKMGLGNLAKTLDADPYAVAPILTRLTNQKRISRRGRRGQFVYGPYGQ